MVLLQEVSFFEAFPHIEKALNGYLWGAFQECLLHQAQYYRVDSTYMMLRVEWEIRELVVVALSGNMTSGTNAAIKHAKSLGLRSIRAHFFRRGAQRFISRRLKENAQTIAVLNDNEHVVQIVF